MEEIRTQEELLHEKELTKPISEEEFKEKAAEMARANYHKVLDDFGKGILYLRDYSCVRRFKSIRRAIRKGYVTIWGELIPKRPFNNKKRGLGSITYKKRRLYEQFTHKNRKVC